MTYVLLLIGFILLIKGANYFVSGSTKIASLLQVPPILVGLTIVAFGTGAPEATVSIIAALEGNTEVTIGNVVGSNMINTAFIIGLTAFIFPLKVESQTIRKEIPFMFLATIVLYVVMSDMNLQFFTDNTISRSDGIIFLLFFSIFLYYIFELARNSRDKTLEVRVKTTNREWGKNILLTVGGLTAIILGGYFVVNSSTTIAYMMGMSETLVGLTIVAIGSSLPELITSIMAALKKQSEIALGNIVGSNIFNILFVLGVSSVITPLPVNNAIFLDVLVMILLTVALLIFSRTNYHVGKYEGITLVLVYVAYFVYIVLRN
ncbi:calcium/sodium antiporter [Evansella sp. AB-P1]|uniref:calcium/sodium antiporter n=1 Tax=Evansella sp. AB-P1 TaxID=3037653 RepID=UPI00241F8EDD|nr:calcium/sodium antiporter [Evansella sp. AB-P1]MDG5786211.1 calcium/sodium antiporter [Evansella sp. AB-P1]